MISIQHSHTNTDEHIGNNPAKPEASCCDVTEVSDDEGLLCQSMSCYRRPCAT